MSLKSRRKLVVRRLIRELFLTRYCGYSKAEPVGAIYPRGNWNSIYHKERLWCRLGLFDSLLKLLNADTKDATLLELDSTFCKVHQSACSGLKNQAIGVSRGGKNTKIHVLINERIQLLNVVLTGGHIHDSEPAVALIKGIKLSGKIILAD